MGNPVNPLGPLMLLGKKALKGRAKRGDVLHASPYTGPAQPYTQENYERLFAESMGRTPERSRLHEEVSKALDKAGVPQRFSLAKERPPITQESVLDWTSHGDFEDAYLRPYDMALPKRGLPDDVRKAIIQRGKYVLDLAQEGAEKGGRGWADMSPLRTLALDRPEMLDEFLRITSPYSAMGTPESEIRAGTMANYMLRQKGRLPTQAERESANAGSVAHEVQNALAARMLETGSMMVPEEGGIKTAKKVGPYNEMKLGNVFLPPSDRHVGGMWGVPEGRVNKNSPLFSLITQEMARRGQVNPAEMLAAPWIVYAPRAEAKKGHVALSKRFEDSELMRREEEKYQRPWAQWFEDLARQTDSEQPAQVMREAIEGKRSRYARGGRVSDPLDYQPWAGTDYQTTYNNQLKELGMRREGSDWMVENPNSPGDWTAVQSVQRDDLGDRATDLDARKRLADTVTRLGKGIVPRTWIQIKPGAPSFEDWMRTGFDPKLTGSTRSTNPEAQYIGFLKDRYYRMPSQRDRFGQIAVGSMMGLMGGAAFAGAGAGAGGGGAALGETAGLYPGLAPTAEAPSVGGMVGTHTGKYLLGKGISQIGNEIFGGDSGGGHGGPPLAAPTPYTGPLMGGSPIAVNDRSYTPLTDDEAKSYGARPVQHEFFQKKAGGGPIGRKIYGGLRNMNELQRYIRSRAMESGSGPLARLAEKPMKELGEGTGRIALKTASEPYVFKVARRPRGITENVAAQDTLLSSEGVTPGVIEVIDDEILLQPYLGIENWDVARRMGREMRTAEAYHGWDSGEMHDVLDRWNLGIVKNYERPLFGDFTADRHWRFNHKLPFVDPDTGLRIGQPTLIDEGAMVGNLLDSESEMKAAYEEMLARRARFMEREDAAEAQRLIEAARKGLATKRAKANAEAGQRDFWIDLPGDGGTTRPLGYAGGGPVRNWLRLRGKPFKSGLDRVLERLKHHIAPDVADIEQRHGRLTDEGLETIRAGDPERAARLDRERALAEWIDKNFANYITREFGAPNDTVLGEISAGRYPRAAWDATSKALVRNFPAAELPSRYGGSFAVRDRQDDMAKFVDTFPQWLRKAYDSDLERHRSGVEHDRAQQGLYAIQNALDNAVKFKYRSPDEIDIAARGDEIKSDMAHKWQRRHQPPITFTDIDSNRFDTTLRGTFNNMLDYLATLEPGQLRGMQVPAALVNSHRWHEAMAKKAAEARASKMTAGVVPFREYPEGYRWVELTEPEALKAEGEAMGHCVGRDNYCRDLEAKRRRFFSLRDKGNVSHVTLDVEKGKHLMEMPVHEVPREAIEGYKKWKESTGVPFTHQMTPSTLLQKYLDEHHPELVSRFKRPSIGQIQGRGDSPAVAKYHPFVQDFIRSNPLGGGFKSVGNVENYGLRKLGDYFVTEDEFSKIPWNYTLGQKWSHGHVNPIPEARGPGERTVNFEDAIKILTQEGGYDALKAERLLREMEQRGFAHVPKDWKPYAYGGLVNEKDHGCGRCSIPDGFSGAGSKDAAGVPQFGRGGAVTTQMLDDLLTEAETKHGLPKGLLHAVALRESNKNPAARGKKGEIGIMQFMPDTAKHLKVDAADPRSAIPGAGAYIADLMRRFGSLEAALMAYNWGPGNLATYGSGAAPENTVKYISTILSSLGRNTPAEMPAQVAAPLEETVEDDGDIPEDFLEQLFALMSDEPAAEVQP